MTDPRSERPYAHGTGSEAGMFPTNARLCQKQSASGLPRAKNGRGRSLVRGDGLLAHAAGGFDHTRVVAGAGSLVGTAGRESLPGAELQRGF